MYWQPDDTVILGSDGLFDNFFPEQIVEELQRDPAASVQQVAERLAAIAFQNSFSEEKATPWGASGGKEDDITVIVARVKPHVASFFK
jgi:serine/threonine protein phosphatase PrpC